MEFPEIAAELVQLGTADQAMRVGSQPFDSSIDRKNTARLKEIIARIGWPTNGKVGPQASLYAWLIAQHADFDIEFQEGVLVLMRACAEPEISAQHCAYLEDRTRVNRNRLQLFGTQGRVIDGAWVPHPIEDPAHVDLRRASVALESLGEYTATMNRLNVIKN